MALPLSTRSASTVLATFALISLVACISKTGLGNRPDSGTNGSGGFLAGTGGALGTGGANNPTVGTLPGTGGKMPATGGDTVLPGGSTTTTGGIVPITGGTTAATGGSRSLPDAGTKNDTATDTLVCGPVCEIYCPYGNKTDANGCLLCSCNQAPDAGVIMDASLRDAMPLDSGILQCGKITCPAIDCAYGYQNDSTGCPTCNCNPAPVICPTIKCRTCTFGYLQDANGCGTCSCAADPDTACNKFNNHLACNAAVGRCLWLAPGCGTTPLHTSGCYDLTLLNCTDSCPSGYNCLLRSVDACTGVNVCESCGEPMAVCL